MSQGKASVILTGAFPVAATRTVRREHASRFRIRRRWRAHSALRLHGIEFTQCFCVYALLRIDIL